MRSGVASWYPAHRSSHSGTELLELCPWPSVRVRPTVVAIIPPSRASTCHPYHSWGAGSGAGGGASAAVSRHATTTIVSAMEDSLEGCSSSGGHWAAGLFTGSGAGGRACPRSLPHEVAGVAAGVPDQVVLVVVLGAVPGRRGDDLGDDRLLPLAGLVDARLHRLGRLLLLLGGVEDRRPVLRPDVVALPLERGRVVHPEEPLLQQVLVAQLPAVEDHLHRLGVPGLAVVGVVVLRVLQPAARVAGLRLDHARDLPDDVLHPPEAPSRQEGGLLVLVRGGGGLLLP